MAVPGSRVQPTRRVLQNAAWSSYPLLGAFSKTQLEVPIHPQRASNSVVTFLRRGSVPSRWQSAGQAAEHQSVRRRGLQIELVDDFRIRNEHREELRALLAECFVEDDFYQRRTFAKQLPHRRLLGRVAGTLVAHIGLDHRVITTNARPVEVFCLVDVCVAPKSRGQGLASSLIAHAEKLAIDNAIDFIILFAPDPRLYQRNGYSHKGNTLRWLKIYEIRTIGIGEEPIPELMVKPLGPTAWPKGTIDLLGPQV